MKVDEVREAIEKAGGDWEVFCDWMYGQTMGMDENGEPDIYSHDVERFIRYKCDPKNEPPWEWD